MRAISIRQRALVPAVLALGSIAASVSAQDRAERTEPRQGPSGSEDKSSEKTTGEEGGSQKSRAEAESAPQADSKAKATREYETEIPWSTTMDAPLPEFLKEARERKRVEQQQQKRPGPTQQQVEALKEMESEVRRFARAGESYQSAVNSLLRREYLRRRRTRKRWYTRQINDEQERLHESRLRAIELFERFIEQYPNDPTYTPDAMFRLGELYYERSAIQFQKEYEAAREAGEKPPLEPDYTPTVELFRELVRKFPEYRRIDGVYYLIGYSLNEMAQPKEAIRAWMNLVCANEYSYDPDATEEASLPGQQEQNKGSKSSQERVREQLEKDHPGLAEEEKKKSDFQNPYASCKPVSPDARFVSETWFRIGEYHFDQYGKPHALDRAIAAYNKILENPEDRNYHLALYKVAWAYYRDSRYPEAIEHFSRLVQWSEEEKAKGGRGSELRPEAIQYLGIAFAYDDWNENQVPDEEEGMPRPVERVQNPELLPQDREWTPEVYFQLGQVLFDEAKYPEAIEVWKLALQRWPMHHRAPEIQNMIARAYVEHKEPKKAIRERAKLSNYGPDTKWYEANKDHPGAQRKAEKLAEKTLIGTAIHYHQKAQQLRRQCVAQQDLSLCDEAEKNYGLAADGYRDYLKQHPNDPQAYELQYNLADALYWSSRYEKAARQYAAVRESNLDDTHMVEAARRVVESLDKLVKKAKEGGELTPRQGPRWASGDPATVEPVKMPKLLQRLGKAREIYINRISDEEDTENVLEAYEFNNALLLYKYGYWGHARRRFEKIFKERCKGKHAAPEGRVAWKNLNDMAVALDDTSAVQKLSTMLGERNCTFGGDKTVTEVDCDKPENKKKPFCVADRQLTNLEFRKAMETYEKGTKASGQKRRQLFESAASKLVEAVNKNPQHDEAPIALELAAKALEKTQRFESAAKLYQRIIDEVGPREPESDKERKKLNEILANAYFQLARMADKGFDFERAVDNYRLLADNDRFTDSDNDKIQKWRRDALINAANILKNLQRYTEASDYYKRVIDMVDDEALKRKARWQRALMAYKQERYGTAIRRMNDFIDTYEGREEAGELVIEAYWKIAQVRKKSRSKQRYRDALQDVVDAYERMGDTESPVAAERAAHAAFLLANDEDVKEYEELEIELGNIRTGDALKRSLKEQVDDAKKEAGELAGRFKDIPGYGRPKWTIASLVRQGRVYESLAQAMLNIPFVMPGKIQRKMNKLRRVDPAAADQLKWQIEDEFRAQIDKRVRPVECRAVTNYVLAARAARKGSISTEHSRNAIDRLQSYGQARIAECIEKRRKEDKSFGQYEKGEFSRAARGKSQKPDEDVGPPSLAGLKEE